MKRSAAVNPFGGFQHASFAEPHRKALESPSPVACDVDGSHISKSELENESRSSGVLDFADRGGLLDLLDCLSEVLLGLLDRLLRLWTEKEARTQDAAHVPVVREVIGGGSEGAAGIGVERSGKIPMFVRGSVSLCNGSALKTLPTIGYDHI